MKPTAIICAVLVLAGCIGPIRSDTESAPSRAPELSAEPSHTFTTPFPDNFWEALPNGLTLQQFIDEDSQDCVALEEYYSAWEPSNVNPAAKILLLA